MILKNKMTEEEKRNRVLVLLLFVISVGVRFVLANFYPKTINCYPDELLYLSTASSIWNQHKILVFQMPSNFTKIGYSILISPAFAFDDIKMQGTIIALINAVLVSCGVFFVYGMARRILEQRKYILLCVMLYLISPTLTYSMTYMSESLYLPMSLALLYLLLCILEQDIKRNKIMLSVCFVFLILVAYFVKTIALAFAVATAMLYVSEKIMDKNKTNKTFGMIMIFSFLIVVSIILKTGIAGVDVMDVKGKFLYICFGSVFFLMTSVLALCVLPILLSGTLYKKLGDTERKFFLFLFFLIVVTAVTVAVMIYAKEDYPSMKPRAHIRYIEYTFVPFLMLLFSLLEKNNIKFPVKRVFVVTGIWSLVHLMVFSGFSGQTMDQTLLFYWQLLAKDGKTFSAPIVKTMSLLVIGIVFALMYLFQKNKKMFERFFVVGIIILCLGNSAMSIYVQYHTHTHTKSETQEAEQIRAYVRENPEKEFWVIEPEGYCELIDTYLIDCENVRTGLKPVAFQKEGTYDIPTKVDFLIQYDGNTAPVQRITLVEQYVTLGYSLYRVN